MINEQTANHVITWSESLQGDIPTPGEKFKTDDGWGSVVHVEYGGTSPSRILVRIGSQTQWYGDDGKRLNNEDVLEEADADIRERIFRFLRSWQERDATNVVVQVSKRGSNVDVEFFPYADTPPRADRRPGAATAVLNVDANMTGQDIQGELNSAMAQLRRHGMKESQSERITWCESTDDVLMESVFDQYALRAVILAGGAGSGKSFISSRMFGGMGLKAVNSDPHLERLMKSADMDPKTDISDPRVQDPENGIRVRAKQLRDLQQANYIEGRLGLIIDTTSSHPSKAIRHKRTLERLGYDVSMVFVNTSLDVAIQRNQKRDRTVPEDILRKDWAAVQSAARDFASHFGDRFVEIENDDHYTDREITQSLVPKLTRAAMKLLNRPLENPRGKQWVRNQLHGLPDDFRKKTLRKFGITEGVMEGVSPIPVQEAIPVV